MQLKEMEKSAQMSVNAPSGQARTPVSEAADQDQNNILPQKKTTNSSSSDSIIRSHDLSG
jgi:hypothetical protein